MSSVGHEGHGADEAALGPGLKNEPNATPMPDHGSPTVALAQRLRGRGFQVEEWTFSAVSVGRLAMTLHLLLREHRLALPDDPDLLAELATVRFRETCPGVYRLDHESGQHDDRAVALAALARSRARTCRAASRQSSAFRGT